MPLEPCRECGKSVSTEAESCPHCGAPTPETTRWARAGLGVGVLWFFAIVFLVGMCFMG